MTESDRTGEKRKEDRKFGVRGCGRGTGNHKNTDVSKRRKISFQYNNCLIHLTILRFIEIERRGVTARRRIATAIFHIG